MDDWHDKYLRLRDEHNSLKKDYEEKRREVETLNVQLTKIENLLKAKDRREGGAYTSSLARQENEKIIKQLYLEKAALQGRNVDLEKRNKKMMDTVQKLKNTLKIERSAKSSVSRASGKAGAAVKTIHHVSMRPASAGGQETQMVRTSAEAEDAGGLLGQQST
eukprot:CAMPEP_0118972230 /NCGR_PEP_ID=MMETSP1173-20130426/8598_1 /TAXON_ID=1034831 /ORGANISM="Rhizochromulina marina cf, Strain CCMP1243" /LENGTH=162 /DNA_ID=CAMNT_0006921751 /DNA_START=26 /DNA_END=510 /DNA_ORIENTATION=+